MVETLAYAAKRIQQLSPLLANQIAAGEVIARPASVVKELLENSLDAGATAIHITLEQGGFSSIQVTDNGMGIVADDLALALSAHATSKIKGLDDLTQIATLGFRGEALAAIAAVSHLTLSSCAQDQTEAWRVTSRGREYPKTGFKPAPCAHPPGTTVRVCDLFYNTPARRKFLRSEKTEYGHIETIVKQLALSRFDVRLQLNHHGSRIVFPAAHSPQEKARRVQQIFGQTFMQHAHFIEEQATDLQLKGWVSDAEFARSQMDFQYFYVNSRIVRDKLISHSLRSAYQDCLPPGRHGAYVLYLTLPARDVDVNVHPTKHEVRFHQARLVHDFVMRQVQAVIHEATEPELPLKQTEQAVTHRSLAAIAPAIAKDFPQVMTLPLSQSSHKTEASLTDHRFAHLLTALNDTVLVCQYQHDLILVDMHAAFAAVTLHAWQSSDLDRPLRAQPLLTPLSVAVAQEQLATLETHQSCLAHLGITFDILTTTSIVVRSVTARLRYADVPNLMLKLVEKLDKLLPGASSMHIRQQLMEEMACLAAPPTYSNCPPDQIQAMLYELSHLHVLKPCPHGRKPWHALSFEMLKHQLGPAI